MRAIQSVEMGHSMAAKRDLLAAVVLGLFAPWASAQHFNAGRPLVAPALTPMQASEPSKLPAPQLSALVALPTVPDTPTPQALPPQAYSPPIDMLTTPATGLPMQGQYPPGTVYSPYSRNANLPMGGNGPVNYETYIRTGPSILAGNNTWTDTAKSGWYSGAGFRTLLFNSASDAAWVIDLGVSYTRNDGRGVNSPLDIQSNQLKGSSVDDTSFTALGIRGLSRTTFNFALGRDWFLNGPGSVGQEPFGNWRAGADIGGRYGTASVDFEPVNEPGGYRRLQDVVHGVFIGSHLNWERSFGNFNFFAGVRGEWGYTWTNLLPTNAADIIDVNLLMSLGFRF